MHSFTLGFGMRCDECVGTVAVIDADLVLTLTCSFVHGRSLAAEQHTTRPSSFIVITCASNKPARHPLRRPAIARAAGTGDSGITTSLTSGTHLHLASTRARVRHAFAIHACPSVGAQSTALPRTSAGVASVAASAVARGVVMPRVARPPTRYTRAPSGWGALGGEAGMRELVHVSSGCFVPSANSVAHHELAFLEHDHYTQ